MPSSNRYLRHNRDSTDIAYGDKCANHAPHINIQHYGEYGPLDPMSYDRNMKIVSCYSNIIFILQFND